MTDNSGNAAGAGAGTTQQVNNIVNGEQQQFAVDAAFNEWAKAKGIENFEKHAKENPEFYKIANSYRNVEKLVGGDKLALPKDPSDAKAWDMVWDKLGRPAKPDDYKFEVPDGSDPTLTTWAKPLFHSAGVTQQQASILNKGWNQFVDNLIAQTDGEAKEKAAADKIMLEKDWGKNFTANQEKATRAWNMMASATGIPQAKIDAMEQTLGLRDSMRMLEYFSRGLKVTGDTFEGADATSQRGTGLAISPEQAQVEKNKYLSDPMFAKKYKTGDKEAREKIALLNKVIASAA